MNGDELVEQVIREWLEAKRRYGPLAFWTFSFDARDLDRLAELDR